MKLHKKHRWLLTLASSFAITILFWVEPLGAAPRYAVARFYELSSAPTEIDPVALNNQGEVLATSRQGLFKENNLVIRAVTISKGVLKTFEAGQPSSLNDFGTFVGGPEVSPDARTTIGTSYIYHPAGPAAGLRNLPAQFNPNVLINNCGTIAGTLSGTSNGFIYKNGLIIHQFRPSYPVDLNNRDEVTGSWEDSSLTESAFLYSNGHFTSIPNPAGADFVEPTKLNDFGVIVGAIYYTSGDIHPFVYAHGQLKDIGLPPGETQIGWAVGINNQGTVAGYSASGPWVWQNGQFNWVRDLVAPGQYYFYGAYAINDLGQILLSGNPVSTASSTAYLLMLNPILKSLKAP